MSSSSYPSDEELRKIVVEWKAKLGRISGKPDIWNFVVERYIKNSQFVPRLLTFHAQEIKRLGYKDVIRLLKQLTGAKVIPGLRLTKTQATDLYKLIKKAEKEETRDTETVDSVKVGIDLGAEQAEKLLQEELGKLKQQFDTLNKQYGLALQRIGDLETNNSKLKNKLQVANEALRETEQGVFDYKEGSIDQPPSVPDPGFLGTVPDAPPPPPPGFNVGVAKRAGEGFKSAIENAPGKLRKVERELKKETSEAGKGFNAPKEFPALALALRKRRAAMNYYQKNTQNPINYLLTCITCGGAAKRMCNCESVLYCNNPICEESHWENYHKYSCETHIPSHFHTSQDIPIVVRQKGEDHPLFGTGSPNAYWVPGLREGETLQLRAGQTYRFVAQEDLGQHPFSIQKEKRGAKHRGIGITKQGDAWIFGPVEQQQQQQHVFYAVCDNHPYMGFEIQIK